MHTNLSTVKLDLSLTPRSIMALLAAKRVTQWGKRLSDQAAGFNGDGETGM